MNRTIGAATVALFVLCGSAFAEDQQPKPERRRPTYLLLRTPRTPAKKHPEYGYTPGHSREVVGRAYSYGWFGVKPRRHWSRHFGFYRNYTEWKAR